MLLTWWFNKKLRKKNVKRCEKYHFNLLVLRSIKFLTKNAFGRQNTYVRIICYRIQYFLFSKMSWEFSLHKAKSFSNEFILSRGPFFRVCTLKTSG